MQCYYKGALKLYSDAMGVANICKFASYNHCTVSLWVHKGMSKIIITTSMYQIPRCFVIKYLCSDWYNNIEEISKTSVCDLGD
jgi:hypothetical protein